MNPDYWKTLVDRYFEGQTDEAEELALKRFLASPAADGGEFDEARAVLGFFAAGRAVSLPRRHRASWIPAAAASLAIVLSLAGFHSGKVLMRTEDGRTRNAAAVKAEMEAMLAEMLTLSTDVESCLNDIFDNTQQYE